MFRKLLVPLDGSSLAEQALGPAAQIARATRASVDLVLVHQPVRFPGITGTVREDPEDWYEDKYLATIARELHSGADIAVTHGVPSGDPIDGICARARGVGADLIVMTSHGRTGFKRGWMGSVADGVVRRARVPVLILRPTEDTTTVPSITRLKRVLVPIDGSELSTEALGPALDLARCGDANLLLLRVVPPVPLIPPGPHHEQGSGIAQHDEAATRMLVNQAMLDLARVARSLVKRHASEVETHVVVGVHAAPAIIEVARARQADAIAMSTHGRGASRFFVGSVADRLLRWSGLPLLLVRPPSISARRALLDSTSVEQQLPALAGTVAWHTPTRDLLDTEDTEC